MLGGADTGAAVELLGFKADDFSLVSTGGGVFLELLQGLGLPGIEVLRGKAGQYAYNGDPRITEGLQRIRQMTSNYAAGIASSPLKPEEVATPLAQGSSAITSNPENLGSPLNPGGIDLAGIKVEATPESVAVNIPLFDMHNFAGFSFQIVNIEEIKDLNAVLNFRVEEKKEEKQEFALHR